MPKRPETLDSLLERGSLLCDANRVPDAMALFAAAAAREPDHPRPHCWLAYGALRLERARDALEHAAAALRCAPDDEWAHQLRAFSLLSLGQPKKAYEAATAAVRCAPADPAGLRVLGSAALERGRVEEASILGRRLMQIAPESPGGARLRALVAERRHDPATAAALYEHVLRLDPRDPIALEALARLRGHAGRHEERAEILGVAVRERPGNAAGRDQLAAALTDFAMTGSRGSRRRSIGAALALLFWLYAGAGLWFHRELGEASPRMVHAYLMGLPVLAIALYPLWRRRFVRGLSSGLASVFGPLVGKRLRSRAKLIVGVTAAWLAFLFSIPELRRQWLDVAVVMLFIGAFLAWVALGVLALVVPVLWVRDLLVQARHRVIGGAGLRATGDRLATFLVVTGAGATVWALRSGDPGLSATVSVLWILLIPGLWFWFHARAPGLTTLVLGLVFTAGAGTLHILPYGPLFDLLATLVPVTGFVGFLSVPLATLARIQVARQRRRMALLIGAEPDRAARSVPLPRSSTGT